MLDFDILDRALEKAVGVGPEVLLGTASPAWANRFFIARERLTELSEVHRASEAESLERDRLSSFFGCVYGEHGFLARAGALQTLHIRLERLGNAKPDVLFHPKVLAALERELAILELLAQRRLSNPLHDDDQPLLDALRELAEAALALKQFSDEVALARGSHRAALRAGLLYGAGELTALAAEMREGLSAAGIASFALARLADLGFTRDARSGLEAACHHRAAEVRRALWRAARANLALRPRPPALTEVEALDRGLAALESALTSPRFSIHARAKLLLALQAKVVASLASAAAAKTSALLDGTLLLIAEGLSRESTRQ